MTTALAFLTNEFGVFDYISPGELAGLFKQYGLHRKATVRDLPATVLAEKFPEDFLAKLCGRYFFGNQFDALRIKNKELYQQINHQQWDLNLSSMAGKRLCGKPVNGKCPHPIESNVEWVKEVRPRLFKTQ